MNRVADTSLFLALIDDDDPRQTEARKIVEDPARILVPPEVLGETLEVLQRRKGFPAAKALLAAMRGTPNLVFGESSSMERIRAEFEAAAGTLSWVDAAVVQLSRAHGARPACLDPDIVRAVSGKKPQS